MSTRFIHTLSRAWLAEEAYGWRAAPSVAACATPYLYAKAMLAAGGSADHVSGMLSAHFAGGVDADLLQYVRHYAAPTPAELLAQAQAEAGEKMGTTSARVLAFDASAAAARADASVNFSEVSAALGVPARTVQRIKAAADREVALDARRRKLLLGDMCSPAA